MNGHSSLVKTELSKGLHSRVNQVQIAKIGKSVKKSKLDNKVRIREIGMITEGNMDEISPDEKQKDLLRDASQAIQICRRYLKVLGVWHQIDSGIFFWRTFLRYGATTICCFLIGIRGIPSGLYIILDEKRPIERLRLIVRFAFVVITTMKYYSLRCQRENIEKCMKHIETDWLKIETISNKKIMLKHAHFGNVLTQIYAVFTYTAVIFLTILPILARKFRHDKANVINITETVTARRFAVPSHFGFSVFSETPLFEFIYFGQIVGTFILHSIAVTCYSLSVVVVTHACGQLTILKEMLNGLVDGIGDMSICDDVAGKISDIIRHHVRALRFIAFGEKMLRGICFVELATYSIVLCFLAYFCLLELQNEHKQPVAICAWAVTFVSSAVNTFALCYIGELLFQECLDVAEVTYMTDWYRLPGKKSLDLSLIIIMARNPTTLTAGGQFILSFKCFATVMQSTLGYVNMLRTVMD